MLTFEALAPLKLRTKSLGAIVLEPGQRVTWPEKAVRQLLQKAPEKIRVVEDFPVRCGQQVKFKQPVNIQDATNYSWQECEGKVEIIDHKSHLVLIISEEDNIPWLWVNLAFVRECTP